MTYAEGNVNTSTARIEPGSIIPVQPVSGGKPIEQLDIRTTPQELQYGAERLSSAINAYLNINPIMPDTQKQSQITAFQTNERLKEYTRANQALVSRSINEGPKAIFNTIWAIMHKFGYVPAERIDKETVDVSFESAISNLEASMEVNTLVQVSEAYQGILGQEYGQMATIYGLDVEKIPAFVADKMGVNLDLIPSDLAKAKMFAAAMQQGQQPQQAPPGGGNQMAAAVPPPVNQPPPIPS